MTGLKGMSRGELANALSDAVASKGFALEQVVAGVVGCNPVRDRIDVEPNLLARLRFADQHLARWNQIGDDVDFRIVEVKGLAVDLAIHLRVGEKYFRWAAFRNDSQHPGLLKLLDGLGGENHRGIVLAPCLLCLHDVVADGLVLDEQPRLVKQECLERRQLRRIGNLITRPVKDVEQKWLQHLRRITPASEVESLKAGKAESILCVVKEKSVLTVFRPTMQPLLQLTDDLAECGESPLLLDHDIHPLNGIPQLSLFLEVEPVTLVVPLYKDTEEGEQELHVFLGLRQTERIDGEVPALLPDIQIGSAEYLRERLEGTADVEDVSLRPVLLRIRQQEIAQKALAAAGHAENQCVRYLAIVKIQVVRRGVVGFENWQIL